MRIDLQPLWDCLANIHIHIHMHDGDDDQGSVRLQKIHQLKKLLFRSRSKLQHAVERNVLHPVTDMTTSSDAHSIPEVLLSKQNPLDVALDELTTEVTEMTTVAESAVALIDGIPALIDAAVEKALAAGATAAELAEVTALSAKLKDQAAKLAAAVTANTPTDQNP